MSKISISVNSVNANEVVFTNVANSDVGTLKVVDGNLVFIPTNVTDSTGYITLSSANGISSTVTEEARIGIQGSLSTTSGVTSTQSTNVVSYNPSTKELTYRELGLYNDSTTNIGLTNLTNQEGTHSIVSNYSILPKLDGFNDGSVGLSLGNEKAYWHAVYAKNLTTTDGTIHIKSLQTSNSMSIKYDPDTLGATISNGNDTVKAVTTNPQIPGQIDASLMPFNGLTFIGQLDSTAYTLSSFDAQTLHLLSTLNFSFTNVNINDVNTNTNSVITTTTNEIFQTLAGGYYTVKAEQPIEMQFSKLTAETDLTEYSKVTEGHFTSPFSPVSTKTLTLVSGDILILTVNLEKNDNNVWLLSTEWVQVDFKVPLNGITTGNLMDFAVTGPKIASASITNPKLAVNAVSTENLMDNSITSSKIVNGSISNSKLTVNAVNTENVVDNSITLPKLSVDLQNLVIAGNSSSNNGNVNISAFTSLLTNLTNRITALETQNTQYQQKIDALEEYVRVMLSTYSIIKSDGTVYSYTGSFQNLI